MSQYEYRVCWRREYVNRKRTRLYQTIEGAEDFAHFLRISSWDEVDDDQSVLGENLIQLGDAIDVEVERRMVSEWSTYSESA